MTSDTEARVTELEIKASFADDLLEQLNTVVAQQQRQLDALQRELQALRQQLRDQDRPSSLGSQADERPPHY
ncbi:SlyX family protein [Inhella gelatinilytica]|uniref:Protein SlyX homolog n=1 Tax=Inhella gelatinilytica TaxID=2795030 RepID=A0A931NED3_9BURK|nr:SlyX family protein [Inhella gelatinilytica]MBH9552396.1 SlyX family protein [Inhella gelatinilytica]